MLGMKREFPKPAHLLSFQEKIGRVVAIGLALLSFDDILWPTPPELTPAFAVVSHLTWASTKA